MPINPIHQLLIHIKASEVGAGLLCTAHHTPRLLVGPLGSEGALFILLEVFRILSLKLFSRIRFGDQRFALWSNFSLSSAKLKIVLRARAAGSLVAVVRQLIFDLF